MGLGADGVRGKWIWPAPSWQMRPLPSCNNRSSLSPKKPTLLALLPFGWSKITEKSLLWQRLGSNLLPHSQAKNPPENMQSSSSNHSAQHRYHQEKASHLCARWILGHLPLGFDLPPENDKINFYCIFFHHQLINSISFTYARLFRQNLVPITHST